MFKPKQKSLKQALAGAVVKAIVTTILMGCGFYIATTLSAMNMEITPSEQGSSESLGRPLAEKSPAWFIQKHDCWTGEAPADMTGKMPGHVVVAKGAADATYSGSKMVGQALSQIFEGKDHDLTVYGFCR